MSNFLENLLEGWGALTFWSDDMREFLKGFDTLSGDYTGSNRYMLSVIIMLGLTVAIFSLYYFVIDSQRLRFRRHWLFFALGNLLLSFAVGFINATAGVKAAEVQEIVVGYGDCFGFGTTISIWALFLFTLFSAFPYPRKLSTNCKYTPWK